MAINAYNNGSNGAALGNLLKIVDTLGQLGVIKTAKNDAERATADATNFKLNEAKDAAAKTSDPNSEESKLQRQSFTDYVNSTSSYRPDKGNAILGLVKGAPAEGPVDASGHGPTGGIPAASAAQINDMKESALEKFINEKMKAQAMANAAAVRATNGQNRLDETKSQNSIKAGDEFESDPIIRLSKISNNSLKRSMSILDNPDKPVTGKDLNLAYNDYINAVTAGGNATEGKIGRELPETFAQEFNTLKGKIVEFDDLRKDATGAKLIAMLRQNIGTVKGDIDSAVADQAYNRHQNFQQSNNEQVKQIAKDKLRVYAPAKYAEIYGQQQNPIAAKDQVAPGSGPAAAKAGTSATSSPWSNLDGGKAPVRKLYNADSNKTRFIFSNGATEDLDGRK